MTPTKRPIPLAPVDRHYRGELPVPFTYSEVDSGRPVNYLRVLYASKGPLALFTLAGLLLGALIVWRIPCVYRSHAYLEVTGINHDLLNKREFDPTAKGDDSSQAYVDTVARLLVS